MVKFIIKILFLLIFINVCAQDTTSTSSTLDTSLVSQTFVMQKSPLGAVLRSAVIPGWGQIYNKSYWKAPVVWGFIAFYGYYWIQNNKDYKYYRDLYNQDHENLRADLFKTNRDFYRDQRDLFAIYIGIVYALNLLDAYVDAHLFDFSVEEDPASKFTRVGIKFNF